MRLNAAVIHVMGLHGEGGLMLFWAAYFGTTAWGKTLALDLAGYTLQGKDTCENECLGWKYN